MGLQGNWPTGHGRTARVRRRLAKGSEKIALRQLADAVDHYGTATLKQVDLVGLRLAAGVTPSGSGEWCDYPADEVREDRIYDTFLAAKKVYTAHGGKEMAWW